MTKWCRVISQTLIGTLAKQSGVRQMLLIMYPVDLLIFRQKKYVLNSQEASLSSLLTKTYESLFPRGSQIDFSRLISKFSVISCSLCRGRTNICLHSSSVSQRAMGALCLFLFTHSSLPASWHFSKRRTCWSARLPHLDESNLEPCCAEGEKVSGLISACKRGALTRNQRWEAMQVALKGAAEGWNYISGSISYLLVPSWVKILMCPLAWTSDSSIFPHRCPLNTTWHSNSGSAKGTIVSFFFFFFASRLYRQWCVKQWIIENQQNISTQDKNKIFYRVWS